jgi:hypothetical protein
MRGETTTETCPSLLERYYAYLLVVVEREVVADRVKLGACVRKPGRDLDLMGADRLRRSVLAEDRGTPEAP